MGNERHVCTADDPWTPSKSEWATHPDARDDGEEYSRDCEYSRYECPHCGLRFKVEIPQ